MDRGSLSAAGRSLRIPVLTLSRKISDLEARLGTRYTVDTLRRLVRRYPRRRFIWLMGEDNLAQFHRWRDWRGIAHTVPIAVIARPSYNGVALKGPAAAWLRRFEHRPDQATRWPMWRLPALVRLRFRLDPTSATTLRAADPDWARSFVSLV